MGKKIYVGIDLGTNNTRVSYCINGRRKLLAFGNVRKEFPSVLYFDADNGGKILVGDAAVSVGSLEPNNVVFSSRNDMGTDRKYQFLTKDEQVIEFTPTDVATEILKTVKERLVKKFRLTEEDEIYAVITTPATFSFAQNEETRHAAERAGLNVLNILPEPTAAAISCMDDAQAGDNVLVVDIGSSTYNIAVITLTECYTFDVVTVSGFRLGGDNFDQAIFEYFKEMFQSESGINLDSQDVSGLTYPEYNSILNNLMDMARETKKELTCSEKCKAERNNLYILDNEQKSFTISLTRTEFDKICTNVYDKIEKHLTEFISAFQKKGGNVRDITHLVLVGGSCYIPAVIELIERKIGIPSIQIADKITAIAEGAALVADNWIILESPASKSSVNDATVTEFLKSNPSFLASYLEKNLYIFYHGNCAYDVFVKAVRIAKEIGLLDIILNEGDNNE